MYETSAVVWIGDRGYRMVFSEFSEVVNGRYTSALIDHDTATIRIPIEHCEKIREAIAFARRTHRPPEPAPDPLENIWTDGKGRWKCPLCQYSAKGKGYVRSHLHQKHKGELARQKAA